MTKVSKQKRSSNRFNVFLDDKYAFSISEDVYIKFHVHKGKQLTKQQIDAIKNADDIQRAYLIAINYLSYRMRTESEIKSHLQKKEIVDDVIEKVIKRLFDEDLLNDQTFAATFVTDRMNRSTKGPNLIRQELAAKGISKCDIDYALATFDKVTQKETALAWGQKEVNKRSKQPLRRRKEQLRTKLLRRGFTKDIVSGVIDQIEIEVDEQDELLLLKKEADKLYTRYKNKYEDYELNMQLKKKLYTRGFSLHQIDSYLGKLMNNDE